jgi:hypothetical protein
MKITTLLKFPFLFLILLMASCDFMKNPLKVLKPIHFVGERGKIAVLYKVEKDKSPQGKKMYKPIKTLKTGSKIFIHEGQYALINECSKFEFTHKSEKETIIQLGKVRTHLNFTAEQGTLPLLNVFLSSCRDPIEHKVKTWTNRLDFDLLPGKNVLYFSGQKMKFSLPQETKYEKVIETYPVSLRATQSESSDSYFILPFNKDTSQKINPKKAFPVVSFAPLNGTIWLIPGSYMIEINGSKRWFKLTSAVKEPLSFELGALRILESKDFPMEERLSVGGKPIYVYLDQSVLLDLNTTYPVFPGNYKLMLEGTEIFKPVVVEKGQTKIIHTLASKVVSSCQDSQDNCKQIPNINIFEQGKITPLGKVKVNVPFLLFDNTYTFGVEGLRGLSKILKTNTTNVAENHLSRLKINWEYKESLTKIRTEIVRLEGRGSLIQGKSLDLLFAKPNEVYIPSGEYALSYFIVDKNLDKTKIRHDFSLAANETKEVSVTIYFEKQNSSKAPPAQVEKSSDETTRTLTPLTN